MSIKIDAKDLAPDFELANTKGEIVRLSAYRGKPVVLVLLRGFM